jgi:hypothetical protein
MGSSYLLTNADMESIANYWLRNEEGNRTSGDHCAGRDSSNCDQRSILIRDNGRAHDATKSTQPSRTATVVQR